MKLAEIIKSTAILLLCIFSLSHSYAQSDDSKPVGNLLTPYDAIFTYSYYLQSEHYNLYRASSVFHKKGKEGRDLALKLKQILDGKGLKFRLSQAPEDANFLDSISKKNVYTPFEKELPEIYLEKSKENGRWLISHESTREINLIYKEVFPFGTHLLLNQLPKLGQQPLLGLAMWQYATMLILAALGFLIHFITSRIFSFIISLIANSNLGKDRFDKKTVKRLGRILSYLLVTYMVFVFVPVLQLPTGLVYYILLSLRVSRTVLFVMMALRLVSLIRSYMLFVTAQTSNPTDEHLVPIVARIINVLIVCAGFVQILSIFYVNVTAMIAGLSIGGLAIALAAQETVKNLFGSMMIYADKPFKIGDMITVGAVTGTIEDIGFRSTRIRTLDTSLISIPNGNLMNETINNLGLRKHRRYNTVINIAYHTPPTLVHSFVEGLREIALTHPEVDKDEIYVHLNNLGPSSIDIIFVIFFNTNEWALELKWKEEIISSILELTASLGILFAYPTTSLHIETMPEKKSNISDYKDQIAKVNQRLDLFKQQLKLKYAKPEENGDLESSD